MKAKRSEALVADWLRKNGWSDVLCDVKVVGVQIDILARSPEGVLSLIEVKHQSALQLAHVSCRQLARLHLACRALAQEEPVEIRLALVEAGQIEWLEPDALTDF